MGESKFKVIWKTIGNALMLPFKGKLHKVEGEDVEKVKGILKEISENETSELLEQLDKTLNKEKIIEEQVKVERVISLQEEKLSAEVSIEQLKSKIKEIDQLLETREERKELFYQYCDDENSNYPFKRGVDGKVYLRESSTVNLPEALIEELVKRVNKEVSIDNLVNFWKLCLLNPNPRSRWDLFKYLTKQKMLITLNGYFLTFRRIKLVSSASKKTVYQEGLEYLELIPGLVVKLKSQKASLTGHFLVQSDERKKKFAISGNYFLVRKDKIKPITDTVLGSIKELSEKKVEGVIEEVEEFTDNYSGKMKIYIGQPVRQDRDKCNENPNVECSTGLHVGTPKFVLESFNASYYGQQLVACLINPQHCVSVPYIDAHKMRVCEYFPFKKVSPEEIKELQDSDLLQYENDYKAIEWDELNKILKELENIESYSDDTLKYSSTEISSQTSREDLKKTKEVLEEIESKIRKLTLSGDKFSKGLSLKEIKSIVESRKVS